MAVRIKTVGALLDALPSGQEQLPAQGFSVSQVLDELVERHGAAMATGLYKDGEIRYGLAFLLNGRNVLGLPKGFDTRLQDGDELIIATIMAGG